MSIIYSVYVQFSAVMMPAAVLASVAAPAGYLSMLLFGGLQHRKYIQNLSEGYVYILGHALRVAMAASCSTPLTPLKFKSETLIHSPNPHQITSISPITSHQSPIRYKISVHLHSNLTKLIIIPLKFIKNFI